ncbi:MULTISPECIES: alpha-hydroxy acid oxidase [Variovorax]|jgi:(S)-mandelate dehydrogenase|uniref:alpha-hydroxy acid oxidase n=1 Tax=Variovorax TaxID=34072 RepID=UPI00086A5FF2|nr:MULTISPECIES: alpha-hydroxy acid oxidase [Variovorax]MBN8752981.1 alpha-hydroxy-acid oxidizing protein [Variovorax sp.]ODU16765.1 MAG: alpha-hydroxy-acid oxidizing enzyme [Variovorax sp. SCN 67-85]ODV24739.1 MAG: alpha-hydroxy-acid oxidizing enzyme [Variovorax sp. SCN 67-20]OJZ15365.1 MAG: alpha-hydroxy-acid oxidizing enzyme [Variovorax sp. 67-131]UKI07911.1 alpha-hydroxy-acid oxidizing protein [Variovorax paradoxus]
MALLLNVDDYRRQARRVLPRLVFDYVDGGAEDERCMRRNRDAIEALPLIPDCLRDTSTVDIGIELFGRRWRAPFAVAPIGLAGLVRPRADALLAGAAQAARVPFILSTASNTRIEDVRTAAPDATLWMQLYVMGERAIAERIVRRARAAGFEALVLTVDVPVSGLRERDLRHGFRVPMRLTPGTVFDMARHPAWLMRLARHGMPRFENLLPGSDEDDGAPVSAQTQAALLSRTMDRTLTWESLGWLRKLWDGPLLVKGLLGAQDARRAVRHGADGIVVSNHGGRQLDAAPASIAALPAIVDAVNGRIPVLMDGGMRRGSDIVKALALGARAVLAGRAPVYGLACDGERGALSVLQLLAQETERTMTLLGTTQVRELGPHHVDRPSPRSLIEQEGAPPRPKENTHGKPSIYRTQATA